MIFQYFFTTCKGQGFFRENLVILFTRIGVYMEEIREIISCKEIRVYFVQPYIRIPRVAVYFIYE